MSRWMVNTGGVQGSAANMDELRRMGREGRLAAGDLVQPPGARDWLYAGEVPELASAIRPPDPGYGPPPSEGMSATTRNAIAGALGLAALGAWGWAAATKASIPTEPVRLMAGENALQLEQALVTVEGAALRAEPGAGAELAKLKSADVVTLVDKKDLDGGKPWWQVKSGETTGWINGNEIVPGWYFADEKVKTQYNAIYNPGQFLTLGNIGATSGPESPDGTANLTVLFQNTSGFEMTGLVLGLSFKGDDGTVLETREFPVEGSVAPNANSMIGTLKPTKASTPKPGEGQVMTNTAYEKALLTDESAADRWMDGAQIALPPGTDLRKGLKVEAKVIGVKAVRTDIKAE